MLVRLFVIFFITGLFTFGGGLATLPILHAHLVEGGWISNHEFVDMIAISQSTPGPIGINLATYIGYRSAFLPGAIVATVGLMCPAYIISVLIIRFIHDYSHNRYVQAIMRRIRPAVIGLIGSAVFFILTNAISPDSDKMISVRSLILFACFVVLRYYKNMHPAIFIVLGAVLGIIFL